MPSIAEYYVMLHTEGMDEVANDLEKTGGLLKRLEAQTVAFTDRLKGFGTAMKSAFSFDAMTERAKKGMGFLTDGSMMSMLEKLKTGATSLHWSLVGVTGSIYGLALAGIHGSVQGNLLAYTFNRFSLELGSIFLPLVRLTIDALRQLTSWLRNLSQAQADNLLKWSGIIGGVALFATSVGKLPGTIMLAVTAFKLLSEAAAPLKWVALAAGVALVVTGFAPLPGMLLAAVSGLSMFGQKGQGVFSNLKSGIDGVIRALGVMFDVLAKGAVILEGVALVTGNLKAAAVLTAGAIGASVAKGAAVRYEKGGFMGDGGQGRDKLLPAGGGGLENISAAYARLAQAAVNQFDPAKAAKKAEDQRQNMIDALKRVADLFTTDHRPKAAAAGV